MGRWYTEQRGRGGEGDSKGRGGQGRGDDAVAEKQRLHEERRPSSWLVRLAGARIDADGGREGSEGSSKSRGLCTGRRRCRGLQWLLRP